MEEKITVLPDFTIKIALDTQLLSYLVDKTYPKLNFLIDKFANSPFVNLVCSRFVTYEFIGIRKKEHYLRLALSHASAKGQTLNISSFLNYRNAFSAPEFGYEKAYENIIKLIEKELISINDDFNISYEDSVLHDQLWNPHKDVYLSSKLSKEDSVVLLSSVFPSEFEKEKHLIFLTNDDEFQKAFNGKASIKKKDSDGNEINVLENVFDDYGLEKPLVFHIAKFSLSNGMVINPISDDSCTEARIEEFVPQFILEQIIAKNKHLYLGRTFKGADKFDENDVTFFKMDNSSELNNKTYLTAINKDLKYVYNSGIISEFCYKKKPITDYPFKRDEDDENVSFEWNNLEESEDEIINIRKRLNTGENILFCHPFI